MPPPADLGPLDSSWEPVGKDSVAGLPQISQVWKGWGGAVPRRKYNLVPACYAAVSMNPRMSE